MPIDRRQADPPQRKRRWFQFSLRTVLKLLTAIGIACVLALMESNPTWDRMDGVNEINLNYTISFGGECDGVLVRGYPLGFLWQRPDATPSAVHLRPWDLTHGVIRFSILAPACDICVLIVIATAVATLLNWRRRLRRSRVKLNRRQLQFTLGECVAVLSSLALICGLGLRWHDEQVELRRSLDGICKGLPGPGIQERPDLPISIRCVYGDDVARWFGWNGPPQLEIDWTPERHEYIGYLVNGWPDRITLRIKSPRELNDRDWGAICGMSRLEHLVICEPNDSDLARLDAFDDLSSVMIYDCHLTDLVGRHEDCSSISADGLRHLSNKRRLYSVGISGVRLTDSEVAVLCGLQNLEELYLPETTLSARAIELLGKCATLQKIDLSDAIVPAGAPITKRMNGRPIIIGD